MPSSPHGYDDETVIPQKRLNFLLGDFETQLNRVSVIYKQHLPGEFHMAEDFEKQFWSLRSCAEELGVGHSFLVEKLIRDYEQFRDNPDSARLDLIFGDVKSLQLLLADY